MEAIRWYRVTREDLLDVLLGEHKPVEPSEPNLPSKPHGDAHITVGFRGDVFANLSAAPGIVALGDRFIADTLSWLRAFAGETFPISQFARVVLASDWAALGETSGDSRHIKGRPDRWACIAVGESLAQSDGDADLQGIPLSRFSSCLTTPVGRAKLLFGEGHATKYCVERLRFISADPRFGRRALALDQLLPVWAIVGAQIPEHTEAMEAAAMLMDVASDYFGKSSFSHEPSDSKGLLDFPGLSSDSVEERVIAFNALSTQVLRNDTPRHEDTLGPLLAAAAFLVGRSTSHAFLLKRFSRVAPVACAWFGAIAALAGPQSWDASWIRAVKGAERLLRPAFDWTDTPGADISWAEFHWMASTFTGVDQLASTPKMLPRTLGIEIVPGAVLQVRVGGSIVDSEPRGTPEPTVREQALKDALGQFVSLAERVSGLLDKAKPRGGEQRSFELERQDVPSDNKPSRPRKRREPRNS